MISLADNHLMFLPDANLGKLSNLQELYLMNNPLKIAIEELPRSLQQAISKAEAEIKQLEEEGNRGVKRKAEETLQSN